jgi:hypothetical protein
MRRTILVLATLAAASIAVVTPGLAPGEAAAAASACSTPWGSLPKDVATMATGEIDHIRVGRHDCFDRLVVQVDGPAGGYRAEYVGEVTADGSGQVVPIPNSGAKIQLIVRHPWYSGPTVGASVANVSGFSTFRGVRHAGSFEGQTTLGIGVRARLPFRVFVLAGPGGQSRLVIDVAHRWPR